MTMVNGSFEMVHHADYSIAVNVAKKFLGKSDLRLILRFINHLEDGSITATDSHGAIVVRNIHGYKENTLLNPNSLEIAKGNYPDVIKVVPPRENARVIIKLGKESLTKWLQIHKSMNQMNKVLKNNRGIISMVVDKENVNFEIKQHDVSFKLPFDEIENLKEIGSISYSCEYMRDALEAHVSLNSKVVELQLHGGMSPFVFDDQERLQTMVLPVRTF
jgi:PII-like signaling protein